MKVGVFEGPSLIMDSERIVEGEKRKQRITICFIVNAAGGKERLIVIGKSENPRCFKRFDKSLLPVTYYYSQKKPWMTGDIVDKILTKLNNQLNSRIVML